MVSRRGPKGNWGVTIVLVGYVALAVFVGFAQPGSRAPIAAERGQDVESKPNRRTHGNQRPGLPSTTLKAFRAAEDFGAVNCGASKECRSEQREYSDLQAQWHAAQAAQGQKHLAIWQTGFAALGTLLLVWTLLETRKANRIARDSYLADQRPWVTAEAEITGDMHVNSECVVINVAAKLRNFGKTPAVKMSSFIKGLAGKADENIVDQAHRYCKFISTTQTQQGTKVGDILAPGEPITPAEAGAFIPTEELKLFKLDGKDAGFIGIAIYVRYQAIGSEDKVYETCVVYSLLRAEEKKIRNYFYLVSGSVPEGSLILERCAGGFAT